MYVCTRGALPGSYMYLRRAISVDTTCRFVLENVPFIYRNTMSPLLINEFRYAETLWVEDTALELTSGTSVL
jgi:hypothetical protein